MQSSQKTFVFTDVFLDIPHDCALKMSREALGSHFFSVASPSG